MSHLAAFRSNMAAMAQMAAQGFVGSAIGIVTSYDPVHYAVKVHLQPPPAEGDATETGWLPVWSPWVGDKWGLFCPPVIGAQVIILFVAGDGQVGICLGALYSDADQPLNVPAGQFWVQDSAGAFLKFTNDGKVLLTAPQGFEVTGDTTITGKLHVTGAATLDSTLAVTGKTTAAEIDSSGPIKVGGVTVTVP